MTKQALLLLMSGFAIQASPAFEVAAIMPCATGTPLNAGLHNATVSFVEPGGRFNGRAVTVAYLMEWAYNIQAFQHSDGPDWLKTDCYDMLAKSESDTSVNQIRAMARTLLAERFRLEAHQETKVLPTLVFSLGRSAPKLMPSKADEPHAMTMSRQQGSDQKTISYTVVIKHYTLTELGEVVSRQLGRVVLNNTGLTGAYDFTLTIVPDESLPNPMDPTMILRAIREDLGLAIDSRDTAMDYLVIDRLERPTAN